MFLTARFAGAAQVQGASPLRRRLQLLPRKETGGGKYFTQLLSWRAQVTHVTRRYWCVVWVLLTFLPDVGCSGTQVLGNASAAHFSTVQQLEMSRLNNPMHFAILFFSCVIRVDDKRWCLLDCLTYGKCQLFCAGVLRLPFADSPKPQGFQK